MLCRHPFVRDRKGEVFASSNPRDWLRGVPFGCGKCPACRVKKRRDWTTRLILEMLSSGAGCFLTLTYSEDYVPVTDTGHRTLSKRDFQLFMKRFRRELERLKKRPYPVRFFACGEYGSKGTMRPHYHVLLFGCSADDLDVLKAVNHAWSEPSLPGQRAEDKRSFGFWTLDPLTDKRVAYAAGYVMKKLIQPRKVYKTITVKREYNGRTYIYDKRVLDRSNSDKDENNVVSEFRLMSRMPGLGSDFLPRLIALWKSNSAFRRYITDIGDVPSVFNAFGRKLFLDRWMKQKLREAFNLEYDPTPYYSEVRSQFFNWLDSSDRKFNEDFVDYLVRIDDQKYRQLIERIKLQLSRRSRKASSL